MKIQVEEKTYRDVNLTTKQMIEIAEQAIREAYDLGTETYINTKGQLVYNIKYHTWEEEVVRKATEEDAMAILVINTLRARLK